jgi:hypothetical protein
MQNPRKQQKTTSRWLIIFYPEPRFNRGELVEGFLAKMDYENRCYLKTKKEKLSGDDPLSQGKP